MKNALPIIWTMLVVLTCSFLACRKTTQNSFSVTVGTQTISFDSLFAWIDTSSASSGILWVNIGGKDTKANNFIYLGGIESPTRNVAGVYFYNGTQTPQLPPSYRWLLTSNLTITNGANKGIFRLTGQNTSKLSIDKYTATELSGSFTVDLNPSLPNGAPDLSTKIAASGQFSVPYRTLP